MSLVPDLLSQEAFEKAFFSVLGAAISGAGGAVGWFGHAILRWWTDRRQTALAVRVVQDLITGAPNLWSRASVGGKVFMQLSGHFRITNATDHPVFLSRIETGFWRNPVSQPRVVTYDPEDEIIRDRPVPPKSTADVMISFELDRPRNWQGRKTIRLFITDSLGHERHVRASFWQGPTHSKP